MIIKEMVDAENVVFGTPPLLAGVGGIAGATPVAISYLFMIFAFLNSMTSTFPAVTILVVVPIFFYWCCLCCGG